MELKKKLGIVCLGTVLFTSINAATVTATKLDSQKSNEVQSDSHNNLVAEKVKNAL